jgi:DNA-binding transcriptional ArsR family regulator
MVSSEWSDSVIALVAGRLALLSDTTRVRLLVLLREREGTVQELSDRVSSTPQNVSRHLGLLHQAGLVARRREGTWVYYSLADYSTCLLLDQVLQCIRGRIDELADIVKLTG